MPRELGETAISLFTTELERFSSEQIIIAGRGQSARLAELITQVVAASGESASSVGAESVLLIVSEGFQHRPWHNGIIDSLAGTSFQVAIQSGMPTPRSVLRIADHVRRQRPAALAAIGGGSVLDAAKSAAVLARLTSPDVAAVRQLCGRQLRGRQLRGTDPPEREVPERTVPVVAVPTTPGTGAEATPFATIWDTDAGRKLSLRGPGMLPAAVVLDPDLLSGLPPSQLASCLLDSLAQGIEANWSTGSDATVELLSCTALSYLARFLDSAPDGGDPVQRGYVQLGGHLAGRAIATAGTTLCHALSYPLTLRYGLPHGHACGVTLSRVLRYNAAVSDQDCADPRGPERVSKAISASVAATGTRAVPDLASKIDTFVAAHSPTIDLRADADAIVSQALSYDRAGNNPRRLDHAALTKLLAS